MTKIKLVIILLKFLLINAPPPPARTFIYTPCVHTHKLACIFSLISFVANKITFTFYLPDQKVLGTARKHEASF